MHTHARNYVISWLTLDPITAVNKNIFILVASRIVVAGVCVESGTKFIDTLFEFLSAFVGYALLGGCWVVVVATFSVCCWWLGSGGGSGIVGVGVAKAFTGRI